MPTATKVEKQPSAESPARDDPMKQVLSMVEKKIRNLEKRKVGRGECAGSSRVRCSDGVPAVLWRPPSGKLLRINNAFRSFIHTDAASRSRSRNTHGRARRRGHLRRTVVVAATSPPIAMASICDAKCVQFARRDAFHDRVQP